MKQSPSPSSTPLRSGGWLMAVWLLIVSSVLAKNKVHQDGSGFDIASKVGDGYGLTGMHERVGALGASLSFDSMPGEGTEVSATLPT